MRRPRIGFLGVGWIGENRMKDLAAAGVADIVAVADPSPQRRTAALAHVPRAVGCEHLGQLLELALDGIVIATPTALHAEQAIAALERGRAVFCQKPLGRTGDEAQRVVTAARTADRLLGVDLSYRYTAAMQQIRSIVRAGGIGRVYAVDLLFHNAYGPEAAWFYDPAKSGGGCVIDLGVHLVDLALWLLDFPRVELVDSHLYAAGKRLPPNPTTVEDFAAVQLQLEDEVVVQLACSWRASAGRDAVIEVSLYGTEGGLAMKNVDGSFYDFVAERYTGTSSQTLTSPPDPWGGRAVIAWAEQLACSPRFEATADRFIDVAYVLDAIYQRPEGQRPEGQRPEVVS